MMPLPLNDHALPSSYAKFLFTSGVLPENRSRIQNLPLPLSGIGWRLNRTRRTFHLISWDVAGLEHTPERLCENHSNPNSGDGLFDIPDDPFADNDLFAFDVFPLASHDMGESASAERNMLIRSFSTFHSSKCVGQNQRSGFSR
jgi:hypothetical protein